MTEPSTASPVPPPDGPEREAPTLVQLSQMTDKEILAESSRLLREQNKLAVELAGMLLAVIQRRYPGPLEKAVEKCAQTLREDPERVWMFLRSEYTTRPVPSSFSPVQVTAPLVEFATYVLIDRSELTHAMQLLRAIERLVERRQRIKDLRDQQRQDQQRQERMARQEEAERREREQARREALYAALALEKAPPTRVVPDAPGCDHKPDPSKASSLPEFVELLGRLHVWAGERSLRELANKSRDDRGTISHTTYSALLDTRPTRIRMPSQRTVTLFVRALGCDEDEVARWVSAWRGLRFARRENGQAPARPRPGPGQAAAADHRHLG